MPAPPAPAAPSIPASGGSAPRPARPRGPLRRSLECPSVASHPASGAGVSREGGRSRDPLLLLPLPGGVSQPCCTLGSRRSGVLVQLPMAGGCPRAAGHAWPRGGLAGADRGAATGDLSFLWNIWGYAGQARGGGCRARVHNPPDYSLLGRPAPDVGSRPAVAQSRSLPARARRIPGTHRALTLSLPQVTCPKAGCGRGPGSSAAR